MPVKNIEVSTEGGTRFTAYRDNDKLKFHVALDGKPLGNIRYIIQHGMCKQISNTLKMDDSYKRGLSQDVLTVYAALMALMVYGNDEQPRPNPKVTRKPRGDGGKGSTRNPRPQRKPSVTYILRTDKSYPRVVVTGSHRSPSGEFSVRGHYRHYKNGKVVWIAEYHKGSGKKKSKTYKIKADTPKN